MRDLTLNAFRFREDEKKMIKGYGENELYYAMCFYYIGDMIRHVPGVF